MALSTYTRTNISVLMWNANILYLIGSIIIGCADFMSQIILVSINLYTIMILISHLFIQSSKICRCWIVWNRNIRIVIIPSIFAVTFFGQSTYLFGMANFMFQLLPSVIWMAFVAYPGEWKLLRQNSSAAPPPEWPANLMWTCLALSLTVNATVTGLIVFRIMKVYLEVKPTLSETNLGATGGGRKLRSIIFILIESGMALFAIQLGRLVLSVISPLMNPSSTAASIASLFTAIQQMLNVIIGPVIFATYLTDSLCFARA